MDYRSEITRVFRLLVSCTRMARALTFFFLISTLEYPFSVSLLKLCLDFLILFFVFLFLFFLAQIEILI